jgi:predicted phosphodiesterase
MQVAIFSDVHGNLTALEAVLVDIKKQSPDLTLFAGDLCLFGARPAECVERIQQEDISLIAGNKDQVLSNQPLLSDDIEVEARERRQEIEDIVDWTRVQLGAARCAWLNTLPFHSRVLPTPHPKDDLFIVHANPHDVHQHIYPPEGMQEEIYGEIKQPDDDPGLRHLLQDLVCGVLAFGHVHVPNLRRWQHILLANISSVSLPQDGDKRAKYGLCTWNGNGGWHIEHQYVAYDMDEELSLLAERQPPGWEKICHRLKTARP